MSSSASLHANLSVSSSLQHSQTCNIRTKFKHKRLTSISVKNRRASCLSVRSVLSSKESIVNCNGATESSGILLQRLKQKLEEQIYRDPQLPQVAEFGLDRVNLESDLHAALLILKKKEEDLQDAERKVLLEYNELSHAMGELETQDDEIAAASSKQAKLEDDLKQANLYLASQALEIKDLKSYLSNKDHEISAANVALSLKELELNNMKDGLMKKSEEAANVESELRSKSQLLDEANRIVRKQKIEIHDLRMVIQEKEKVLDNALIMQKVEGDKLKVAEANLEKQTMNWLLTQGELKKLAKAIPKHSRKENVTYEDFKRVKVLLANVRYELLSSRKSLASLKKKIRDQERMLQQQQKELGEERRSVMSYMTLLGDAQVEVGGEKLKLRLAEAKKVELERDLSMEKELVQELQNALNKERSSLQEAMEKMSLMKKELDLKTTEFEEVQNHLKVKESELVEARFEIQRLKTKQASLQLTLQEKDLELLNTRKKFDELSWEITELRVIMKSKEDQLMQATTLLKEKNEEVLTIHHELKETKQKFLEAETAVEGILELTNKLVISVKDDLCDLPTQPSDTSQNYLPHLLESKPANSFKWQKRHPENELELTKENLRTKDREILAAQSSLKLKDNELKLALEKLDAREKELRRVKDEMTQESGNLKQHYASANKRVGVMSLGEFAVEKLQFEGAKASLVLKDDYGASDLPRPIFETKLVHNECLVEVHAEVARLSVLTEQLVQEAGIVVKVH
ncbi:unnamed protein product [Cuscuta epithymum]|uniref:Uncharacterized protein n=1 Tax=Cuscuta epithymum TaxID=186058 RepID=A0AAV0D248_9ASTE|nr:unnamed protein product [Cuscuta epithymum]